VDRHGEEEAERRFDELAEGERLEESRRREHIDPEQGEAAYHNDDAGGDSS
jgi:hypothetical protein